MASATPQVQEYWLPGFGLSRNIVLSNIQYFLGPSATVRPYTYQVITSRRFEMSTGLTTELQGREGYLIVGMPLTRVGGLQA